MTEAENGHVPLVWLVIGDKPGDNAQVMALARALGWPFVVKQVFPKPEWVLGKPRFVAGLDHLDLARSATLEPPWPDLVLTVGRRSSAAALWIREQSNNRTKIVLIGRPKRWLEKFALVVAPSQFRLPDAPNVVSLGLPLMRADPTAVEAAATVWRSRLAGMARPLTAVFVGGATKPFRFDAEVAAGLVTGLQSLVDRDGGSLFITTSRRTRPDVVEALQRALPSGSELFAWRADAMDNPFLGLLGLADRFVVTGDSISMLVEVASLNRPLAIFPLPTVDALGDRLRRMVGRLTAPGSPAEPLARSVQKLGLAGYSRDLELVHQHLFDRGAAVPFGQPFKQAGAGLDDELGGVVQRVRGLLAEP